MSKRHKGRVYRSTYYGSPCWVGYHPGAPTIHREGWHFPRWIDALHYANTGSLKRLGEHDE